jgi:hypothetical protein
MLSMQGRSTAPGGTDPGRSPDALTTEYPLPRSTRTNLRPGVPGPYKGPPVVERRQRAPSAVVNISKPDLLPGVKMQRSAAPQPVGLGLSLDGPNHPRFGPCSVHPQSTRKAPKMALSAIHYSRGIWTVQQTWLDSTGRVLCTMSKRFCTESAALRLFHSL